MSECRCDAGFDNREGHASYCPAGKDECIAQLQADNKALQSQLSEVVSERGALKERVAELESTRKDWCITFHFWWMGVGGTNTYQGYADWLKLGCPIAAGPAPTIPRIDKWN